MGGQKSKAIKTPFQQQQQQTNTFAPMSISDSPEAKSFLETPLDFGGGGYVGDAYKDIKTDFNLDPGVGRRTDLAEQGAMNRWDSALMAGVPAWLREQAKQKEMRGIRGQGAAEAQQAEYGRQQAEYGSSLARAQMRDSSELARAQMGDEAARARTMAELERRRLLLPQILQTGGSGSSSGYNTQLTQPTPGFLSSFGQGLGSGIGGIFSAFKKS